METFEAISYIRNSKNVSIKDTLGEDISQSSYYRYINGESDLNSQNFLTILDNLNISLDEVNLIRRGYKNKEENILLLRIKKAFEKQNEHELKEIKKHCQITQKHNTNIVFTHLQSLIDLLINRLSKKEIDISNTEVFKYLVQTETWSRYELVLFNNTLFYFSPDAVDQILPRAVDKLIRHQVINPYTNEAVILLANAIVFFIKENDFERAIQYIDMTTRLFLTEEQVYERLLVKCLQSMRKILFKDKTGFEEMEYLFSIMEFFKMDNISKMFNKLIYDLKYNIL